MVDHPDLLPSYFPCLDARPGTNRDWQSVEVSFRDTARLRSVCKDNDVSTISVFQAAWAMVLRCYLGNASVCFASYSSTIAEEVDNFWEPHLDLSICQIDFASAFSVSDLFKGVLTRHLRSSPQPQKSPSSVYESHHSDILPINTYLVYREDRDGDWSAMDRPAIRNYTSSGFEESEIIVDIKISKKDLFIEFNYTGSVLSTVSASNVADVYKLAITKILTDLHQPLDEIDLLSQRDLAQIQAWNTAHPQVVNACVHELLLQHAKHSPQSPALCSWDGNLTYHDLDALTFRLAGHFVCAGIRTEMLVPLCFRKSMYAIIAMVAIHRAGGAFVPLDPSHPVDRLKAIIKRTNAQFVVASPETAYLFRDTASTVIEVSSSMLGSSKSFAENTLPKVWPHHAAFVLFTLIHFRMAV